MVVNKAMAIYAESKSILDFEALLFVAGKAFYMMGMKLASTLVAMLTGIIITLENRLSPFLIFDSKAGILPSFPGWMFFASLPTWIMELHRLSPLFRFCKLFNLYLMVSLPRIGLTSSLRSFLLFSTPVNSTTGRLIAGHGRVDALLQLKASGAGPLEGIEVRDGRWLMPVDYISIPEEEEEALSIALNRTVELGGWDEARLADG